MKKATLALILSLALTLSLTGCGKARGAESEAPAQAPQVTEAVQPPAVSMEPATPAPTQTPEPAPTQTPAPVRQDGERFETTIILEGMAETVHYEHIRNDALGFEMDYDYESFTRRSEPNRECFISIYDDPQNPENYLEVTALTQDADSAAAFAREALSKAYELLESTRVLERAGSSIRIEAAVLKGTNLMADQLQTVYIIPAPDGCRVATVHSEIVESEGFGHRFSYMLNTLAVTERRGQTGA